MSKRHHFIESDTRYEYNRVIFCTACGIVVYCFDYDNTAAELQRKVGIPCIEAAPHIKKED